MKTFNLTVIASGLDPAATHADRFFDAGCDDATVSVQKGLFVIEFDREARSFAGALLGAIRDVQKTGATVERIEPDHLVSASEIAKRSGLGRAAISLYAKGERGQGFPLPVARVTTDSPLWDWVDVAGWMYRESRLPLHAVVQARLVRAANHSLERGHPGIIANLRRVGADKAAPDAA